MRIYLIVQGGLVQDVFGPRGTEVVIIDYDLSELDPENDEQYCGDLDGYVSLRHPAPVEHMDQDVVNAALRFLGPEARITHDQPRRTDQPTAAS